MNLELARAVLIDHSRSKQNGRFPPSARFENQMTNPICGDHVQIKFDVNDQRISDFGFATSACAICSASTSLMSEFVVGKKLSDLQGYAELFENGLLARADEPWPAQLGPLVSFEHLRVNPSRRACALLPWVALKSSLKGLL